MKKLQLILILALGSFLYGQSHPVTVGVLGTRFSNNSEEFRLSQAKNPLGFGILAGYHLDKMYALGFTAEYFSASQEQTNNNNEKAIRTGISVFAFPYAYKNLHFFVSGGVINTIRFSEANGETNSFDFLNGRFSAGIDFVIIPGFSVAYDAGVYTNGWNATGTSHSLGIRYSGLLIK